jgi:Dual specificity phosphatase, catalytic domain
MIGIPKLAVMVHPGLFVGNGQDIYKFAGSLLHCARDPWYTNAIQRVRHPEKFPDYGIVISGTEQMLGLVARLSYNEMALNMVDAASPMYFCDEMVDAGLNFITDRMAEGDPVLVHCQLGISRSPSVAMLWLYEHGFLDDDFDVAVIQFKRLYPDWTPGHGIWTYLKNRIQKVNKN